MRHRILSLLFCITALVVGSAGIGRATPIGTVNGSTQLNVTSLGALTNLGVTVAPTGTAQVVTIPSLPSPIVFYPVTSVDLDSGEIFHAGAVLDLTTTATVSLSDFVVDAGAGFVFANVGRPFDPGLTGAPIFSINKTCSVADPCVGLDGTSTISGLELIVTAAAAGVLVADLGIPDLTGVSVAVANSSFTLVPEPGMGCLMLTGLMILGVVARRDPA